jgi:hypothetical protein
MPNGTAYTLSVSREAPAVETSAVAEYEKFLGRVREQSAQDSLCRLLQTDDLSREVAGKMKALFVLHAGETNLAAMVRNEAAHAGEGDHGVPLKLDSVVVWNRDDMIAALRQKGDFDGFHLSADGKDIDFAFSVQTGGAPIPINVIVPATDWDSKEVQRVIRQRLAFFESVFRTYHSLNSLLPAQAALRASILRAIGEESYSVRPPAWFVSGSASVGAFSVLRDLLGNTEAGSAYNAMYGKPESVEPARRLKLDDLKLAPGQEDLVPLVAANLAVFGVVERYGFSTITQVYSRAGTKALGRAPSFAELYTSVVKQPVPETAEDLKTPAKPSRT